MNCKKFGHEILPLYYDWLLVLRNLIMIQNPLPATYAITVQYFCSVHFLLNTFFFRSSGTYIISVDVQPSNTSLRMGSKICETLLLIKYSVLSSHFNESV